MAKARCCCCLVPPRISAVRDGRKARRSQGQQTDEYACRLCAQCVLSLLLPFVLLCALLYSVDSHHHQPAEPAGLRNQAFKPGPPVRRQAGTPRRSILCINFR